MAQPDTAPRPQILTTRGACHIKSIPGKNDNFPLTARNTKCPECFTRTGQTRAAMRPKTENSHLAHSRSQCPLPRHLRAVQFPSPTTNSKSRCVSCTGFAAQLPRLLLDLLPLFDVNHDSVLGFKTDLRALATGLKMLLLRAAPGKCIFPADDAAPNQALALAPSPHKIARRPRHCFSTGDFLTRISRRLNAHEYQTLFLVGGGCGRSRLRSTLDAAHPSWVNLHQVPFELHAISMFFLCPMSKQNTNEDEGRST